MDRLEFVEGGSSKFWMAEVQETTLVVHFGRIGTEGQVQVKKYATAAQACHERDKRMAEKRRKGYRVSTVSDADRAKMTALPLQNLPTTGASRGAAFAPASVQVQTPVGFWGRLLGRKPEVVAVAPKHVEPRCDYCDFLLTPGVKRCTNCAAKV
jgi:predicted DNA-binding WGR domain protein